MTRVLALLPYPLGRAPGQRYRIEQWAPHLRASGIELEFEPFLSAGAMDVLYRPGRRLRKAYETIAGYAQRVFGLRDLERYDAAFVYRESTLLGGPWIERRLAKILPILFDFDDAIYLPAVNRVNSVARILERPGKAAEICALARHVTVGNRVLAEFARQHASDVTVVPSTIDTQAYVIRERPANPRPVIGWTGTVTTTPYLEALQPALASLCRAVDFELRVIGHPVRMNGVDVRFVPWNASTEAEDLRPIDVGLMPLPDDPWARGKCGMKALQYMALGIPPVVSPVGVNATIVQDGRNGFHARTDADWTERLELLLRDPALRARLGVAARVTVENEYSTHVHAPRVAKILRRVAAS
jgi:glycosyltransferase involved in cell wall biosynthesis